MRKKMNDLELAVDIEDGIDHDLGYQMVGQLVERYQARQCRNCFPGEHIKVIDSLFVCGEDTYFVAVNFELMACVVLSLPMSKEDRERYKAMCLEREAAEAR